MPVPPSLVAEPPAVSTIRWAPASSAALNSSPTPCVSARSGSRSASAMCSKPAALAISIMAVWSGNQPQHAVMGRPRASATVSWRRSPPVTARTASSVPSPPSAMGTHTTCASGTTDCTPRAIACATPAAERLSLKESGAMTIFTGD